jgi:hypothetical protein
MGSVKFGDADLVFFPIWINSEKNRYLGGGWRIDKKITAVKSGCYGQRGLQEKSQIGRPYDQPHIFMTIDS